MDAMVVQFCLVCEQQIPKMEGTRAGIRSFDHQARVRVTAAFGCIGFRFSPDCGLLMTNMVQFITNTLQSRAE